MIPQASWHFTSTPGTWQVVAASKVLVVTCEADHDLLCALAERLGEVSDLALAQRIVEQAGLDFSVPHLGIIVCDDSGIHGVLRGRVALFRGTDKELIGSGVGARTWFEIDCPPDDFVISMGWELRDEVGLYDSRPDFLKVPSPQIDDDPSELRPGVTQALTVGLWLNRDTETPSTEEGSLEAVSSDGDSVEAAKSDGGDHSNVGDEPCADGELDADDERDAAHGAREVIESSGDTFHVAEIPSEDPVRDDQNKGVVPGAEAGEIRDESSAVDGQNGNAAPGSEPGEISDDPSDDGTAAHSSDDLADVLDQLETPSPDEEIPAEHEHAVAIDLAALRSMSTTGSPDASAEVHQMGDLLDSAGDPDSAGETADIPEPEAEDRIPGSEASRGVAPESPLVGSEVVSEISQPRFSSAPLPGSGVAESEAAPTQRRFTPSFEGSNRDPESVEQSETRCEESIDKMAEGSDESSPAESSIFIPAHSDDVFDYSRIDAEASEYSPSADPRDQLGHLDEPSTSQPSEPIADPLTASTVIRLDSEETRAFTQQLPFAYGQAPQQAGNQLSSKPDPVIFDPAGSKTYAGDEPDPVVESRLAEQPRPSAETSAEQPPQGLAQDMADPDTEDSVFALAEHLSHPDPAPLSRSERNRLESDNGKPVSVESVSNSRPDPSSNVRSEASSVTGGEPHDGIRIGRSLGASQQVLSHDYSIDSEPAERFTSSTRFAPDPAPDLSPEQSQHPRRPAPDSTPDLRSEPNRHPQPLASDPAPDLHPEPTQHPQLLTPDLIPDLSPNPQPHPQLQPQNNARSSADCFTDLFVASTPDPGHAASAIAPPDGRGWVAAVACASDHMNPPGSEFCRVCSRAVKDQVKLVAQPVLATLTSSDGSFIGIDGHVVIGRSPSDQGDPEARTFVVSSPNNDVSRTHLSVTARGWQIEACDLHSTNGTILNRLDGTRLHLEPGRAIEVRVGESLDLGDGQILTITELD